MCNPRKIRIEADLLEELGRLPPDLYNAYETIYRQILESGNHSRSIAIKVLQWLKVAQRPLRRSEIIAALVSPEERTLEQLKTRDILNMTCNLVVEDTALDCLRYAHVSVLEFLEKHADYGDNETHKLAAVRCLKTFLSKVGDRDHLLEYASKWWSTHYTKVDACERQQEMRDTLIDFCFCGSRVAPAFESWRQMVGSDIGDMAAAISPFYTACVYGIVEILDYCTTNHVQITGFPILSTYRLRRNYFFGYHGIHIAVHGGHYEVVDFLLDYGVSSSICTDYGETLLHVATRCSQPRLIDLILLAGADVNAISSIKSVIPPLLGEDAEIKRNEFYVDVNDGQAPDDLLERISGLKSSLGFRQSNGRVLSVIDEDFEAPLHRAARNGDIECLKELLQHSADVNIKTALGSTALHLAVLKFRKHVVEVLLASGADPNATLTYGRTPLHLAAASGQEDVSLLIRHGADQDLRDNFGNTAQNIAKRYGFSATSPESSYQWRLPGNCNDDEFELHVTEYDEQLEAMDRQLDESLDPQKDWSISL